MISYYIIIRLFTVATFCAFRYIKYTDKNNPTAQELNERNLIIEYNKRVDKKQILPILKRCGELAIKYEIQ